MSPHKERRRPHKVKAKATPEMPAAADMPIFLRKLGVRPRKSLGQHFLVDEMLLGDIATAAVQDPAVPVLEIGAGPGGLTQELLKRAQTVVSVEIDEDLSALTRARLTPEHPGLQVIAADILQFEPVELLAEAGTQPPYVAVGNLPYYITQPIVRMLLETAVPPDRIVVLVQREVALRMVGGPGRESLLSMSIKLYGEPKLLFDVPATAFWPPPKVRSAVVSIDRFAQPELGLQPGEIAAFFMLVRAGFAQPRKQLHNILVDESGYERGAIVAVLEEAGIDPVARPQHLALEDWGRLFRAFIAAFPEALDVE
jgi:16S rRNA (adenine1518-N6/adenine1519-N6)-dimethyltransferase